MDGQERITGNNREWVLAQQVPSPFSLNRYLLHLKRFVPPLLVALAVIIIVTPIWGAGYPWGSDTWGHLHRANYMREAVQEYGWIDGFLNSAWMTDWYMGDPTRVYYPPLTAWVLGGLSAVVGDVFVAYRVFISLVFAVLSGSVYIIGMRWSQNRWAALVGAILAITAPYTLRTIFAEGNLPRALVVLTLPWIIWWTEMILTQKRVSLRLVGLSLLWALALTTHVMQAVMFVIVIALFIVARTMSSVYIPLRRVPLALLPIGIGGLLAAFYLLPAYSHIELANVPYLPDAKIDLFSIDLNALAPIQTHLEGLHIGSVSLLLALIIVLVRGTAVQRVLLSVALLTIVLAFGNASGIYRIVPLNQMMLPERFLNAAAILVPLTVALCAQFSSRKHFLLMGGLLLVIVIEFIPAWRMMHMRPAPVDEQSIAQVLRGSSLPGRIASLTSPSPTAAQIYLTSETSGRSHISGWGLENTPHQDAIRRLLAGMERSPEYIERLLSLWQSDYVITRPNDEPSFDNFFQVASTPSLTLWQRDIPSSFVQTLPDNRMLIIGDNATSWLFSFPFASEGHSSDISVYDADYLSHYTVIGLSRFTGSADALYDWVAEGRTLIVDLSGYDPILVSGYTLFGVQSLALSLNGPVSFVWSDDFSDMPDTFADGMLPWVGATYRGLDEVIASVRYQGIAYPLMGRQNIGNGTVWYIGFNLLYWLDITHQVDARAQVVDLILANSDVDRSLMLPPAAATNVIMEANELSFDISVDEPTNVILSMTYFPRWVAEINGETAPIFNHEHLIAIPVPSGQHTVTLRYHPYSSVSVLGAIVSIMAMPVMFYFARWLHHHPFLALEDRKDFFFDRHASHVTPPLPPPVAHTTCPACRSDKALIGPPTANSYPFVSITCPACGYEI